MTLSLRHFTAMFFLLSFAVSCDPAIPAKMPHVREEALSHAVLFHDGSTQLYPSEQDSLASFVSAIPPGGVSSVTLAANDSNLRAVARAQSVRSYLTKQGFNPNDIRLQSKPGIDPLMVMLNVRYAKAVPPEPCPDWSKNSGYDYENRDQSNFGCAYYNDLIVQLDNPADYNHGHGTPVIDAPRDSAYLQRYLSGTSASGGGASTSSGASGGGTTTTTTSSP
jgi:pilus biogenesis lipoprotein CpaD